MKCTLCEQPTLTKRHMYCTPCSGKRKKDVQRKYRDSISLGYEPKSRPKKTDSYHHWRDSATNSGYF